MDYEKLAELLFSDIKTIPEEYENKYAPRSLPKGARVTRFAPSPTGYLHIGGLFSALISKLTADVSGGSFYLRIEDTDKKREVEDGVSGIVKGLSDFGIDVTEGVTGLDSEVGDYGPYTQSKRVDIYKCFAKDLVRRGLAYPCFCTPKELSNMREEQEKDEITSGYYGEFAKCRNLSFEEISKNISAGIPYAIRLRSPGTEDGKVTFDDLIKGKIEMPENIMDIVLLKTDGIPTYHFAHCIDDHLMRTSCVVRGDEWISSVPIHIQLFRVCGFKVPKYAHIAPIMKLDDGGKRKLSKRKDPEAAVEYYSKSGYPKESVLEYLFTLANSNFEDWRRANQDALLSDFPFSLKKMSVSGALFDLQKLNDVSKNVISFMSADEVLEKTLAWAKEYNTSFYELLVADETKSREILNIDRKKAKPRKDIAKWSEVLEYVSYFFNEIYEADSSALPENINRTDAVEILKAYNWNATDDKDEWFQRVKDLCEPFGFTPNVKEYKENPDAFKGHVGDVSTVIRVAMTSRTNTPDLYSIMQILGEDEIKNRIKAAIAAWEKK
ncbi:MAG: glutamate--tRNA ligase [Ruminococcaceae bacterium]|nr:glutamate--tRNA ligase [Oscillospiraceae bacterium]